MRLQTLLERAVGQAGAVVATLAAPGWLVIAARHSRQASVTGVELGATSAAARWQRALEGDLSHMWAGHRIELNEPSVVGGDGRVWAVGARERLLIEAATGDVMASTDADAAPSAAAAVVGDELVVPQGRSVVWYDAATLRRSHDLPNPEGMWASAPPFGTLVALNDDDNETTAVWDTAGGNLWRTPAGGRAGQPVAGAGFVALPTGAGGVSRLTIFDATTGAALHVLDYPDPAPRRPPEQGRYPVRRPLALHGQRIVAVTATPSVVAIDPDGTTAWASPLGAHPTTFAQYGQTVWVGTSDRHVVALDAETGTVLDETRLPGPGDHAVQVLPTGAGSALVVGRLGSVHRADP